MVEDGDQDTEGVKPQQNPLDDSRAASVYFILRLVGGLAGEVCHLAEGTVPRGRGCDRDRDPSTRLKSGRQLYRLLPNKVVSLIASQYSLWVPALGRFLVVWRGEILEKCTSRLEKGAGFSKIVTTGGPTIWKALCEMTPAAQSRGCNTQAT